MSNETKIEIKGTIPPWKDIGDSFVLVHRRCSYG